MNKILNKKRSIPYSKIDKRRLISYPKLNSSGFKKLEFKDQIYLTNLFIFNKEEYCLLTGEKIKDPSIAYIDKTLEFLNKEIIGLPQILEKDLSFSFTQNLWGAYLSYYNPKLYIEGFSPLDDLNIKHNKIFSLQLFTFPILSMDSLSSSIIKNLLTKFTGKYSNDLFYHLIRIRASMKYFQIKSSKFSSIFEESLDHIHNLYSISEVNKKYPIIQNSELISLIEEDVLVPLFINSKYYQGYRFVPLIPVELYKQPQFSIKLWDFLLSS